MAFAPIKSQEDSNEDQNGESLKWSEPVPQQFDVYAEFNDPDAYCAISGKEGRWTVDVVSIDRVDIHVNFTGSLEVCKKRAEAAYRWAVGSYPKQYFNQVNPSLKYIHE